MLAAILTYGAMETTLTSCSDDTAAEMPVIITEEPEEPVLATITSKVHDDKKNLTIINFDYPSSNPNGNAATLSAAIIIGDEVQPGDKAKAARGFMIYNHFTVYGASECPTRGDTKIPEMVAGSGLITVAADYYVSARQRTSRRLTVCRDATHRPALTLCCKPRGCLPRWAMSGAARCST